MKTLSILILALAAASAAASDGVKDRSGAWEPAPTVGRDLPESGHTAVPRGRSQYNIWSRNCHTEANFFTANATVQGIPAGILACQGDPERSPEFHTASWVVLRSGRTCIYNYGQPCCWRAAASPPDISRAEGQRCAQQACGDQYREDETRAMPAGRLVESPGPFVCAVAAAGGPMTLLPGPAVDALSERLRTGARTVRPRPHPGLPEGTVLEFPPERLDACLDCCRQRAQGWSGLPDTSPSARMHAGRGEQFRMECERTCRGSFPPAASPGAASRP